MRRLLRLSLVGALLALVLVAAAPGGSTPLARQLYAALNSQNVNLAMCHHATEPALELIWPGTGAGPVDGLIQRHASGIVYHACYETSDLAAALAALEAAGVKIVCVSEPKPAPLFDGRKVSFYNVLGMGLIEILEAR